MEQGAALRVVPADGDSEQPRCGGETKSGRPCRREVAKEGVRCPQHRVDLSSVKASAGMGRRELLESLRNRIAEDIDEGVPPRDLASLSKRLLDIAKELEALEAAEDGDDVSAAAETPDEPLDG